MYPDAVNTGGLKDVRIFTSRSRIGGQGQGLGLNFRVCKDWGALWDCQAPQRHPEGLANPHPNSLNCTYPTVHPAACPAKGAPVDGAARVADGSGLGTWLEKDMVWSLPRHGSLCF